MKTTSTPQSVLGSTDMATNSTATGAGVGPSVGLAVLRAGTGAAALQAGLIKALDFPTTVGFMAEADWRLPTLAAFMVTAAEVLGGLGLLLGMLTPVAACAVLSAMLCAWAVNVSGAAFWAEPFNVAFLIAIGAAALLFTGAGSYSVDTRLLRRPTWSVRLSLVLLGLAVAAAVVTWVALYGVNPIHLTTPAQG